MNAPPGTRQELSIFLLPGDGSPRQTLDSVSQAAMAAAMAMQGADIAPTAGQVAAAAKARADVKAMMDQWSALKASSPVK